MTSLGIVVRCPILFEIGPRRHHQTKMLKKAIPLESLGSLKDCNKKSTLTEKLKITHVVLLEEAKITKFMCATSSKRFLPFYQPNERLCLKKVWLRPNA